MTTWTQYRASDGKVIGSAVAHSKILTLMERGGTERNTMVWRGPTGIECYSRTNQRMTSYLVRNPD